MARKKKAVKKTVTTQRIVGKDEYIITTDQLAQLRDIITDFNTVISNQLTSALDDDNDKMRIGFDLGRIDLQLDTRVEKAVAILDTVNPPVEEENDWWNSDDEDESDS